MFEVRCGALRQSSASSHFATTVARDETYAALLHNTPIRSVKLGV